ncbi:MAG: GDSL-type esterase/lipase family protein [Planctomycetota bacterium]|nr:GDSL-type esterase/lipase family protein [Planctomycetota bacterium]
MRGFFKKYWKQIIVVSFSTMFGLLVGEVAVRVSANAKYLKRLKKLDEDIYVLEENPLVYTLKANLKRHNRVRPDLPPSWWMHLNEDGLRGPLPKKDKKTILCLGDSYTFGWAVHDEESYPAVLGQTVEREFPEYQVINGGMPGYNTIQEFHFLKRHWDHWQPKVVILGYVVNDAEPQLNVPSAPAVKFRDQSSWLWYSITRQTERGLGVEKGSLTPKLYEHSGQYADGFAKDSVKWKESREALKQIAEFCKRKDVPLVVVMFPGFSSSLKDDYPFKKIHDAVGQWTSELKIEFRDQLDLFKGRDYKLLHVPLDGHPNSNTNKEIALDIYKNCLKDKLQK